MTSKLFASLALAGAVLGLGVNATAGLQTPSSLLVYPCYDNVRGTITVITVTNTNTDTSIGQNNLPVGTVDVEFVYINGDNCLETNRTRRLTPGDTLSVLTVLDNPNAVRGYVYVFAKKPGVGAISFNHLIGTSFAFSGSDARDFELAPICFKGVPAEGAATDLDSDGRRDLNGLEYSQAPDELAFARFTGQAGLPGESSVLNGAYSQLVLINLAGARFNAVLDFLIYNDNEEVYSAQYEFYCWKEVDLDDINGAFTEAFLDATNNNPLEQINGSEYGWMRMNGNVAYSTADSVADPMVLALLVENIGAGDGGELPFGAGEQTNGELVSHSIFHD